jgi:hypothetical protein
MMSKQIRITLMMLVSVLTSLAQNKDQKVFTSDVDNFWIAYDSVRATRDSTRQLHFINTLYIDKGTNGLKAFMKARDYTAGLWVTLINRYPRFWNSVRPNTLAVKSKAGAIERSIKKLKELYPGLREAKLYFTIGGLRSGGTTTDDMVLIGTEIATGNAKTDASEFPNKWLGDVFKVQPEDNIIPLSIHEYVHTQQTGNPQYLLGHALKEGSCDFIAELVIDGPLQNNYIQYGRAHEHELKEKFKDEMFSAALGNWLYNGANAKTVADLGYFMGYAVCKSYYTRAVDKKQAIKDIITLDYSNDDAVDDFLLRSRYYDGALNKAAIIKAYEGKRPYVIKIEPLTGDSLIEAGTKELKIIFSVPMSKGYSINFGKRGKEYSPITGVAGFSDDMTSFTIKIDVKAGHEYEFLITDKSFRSAEGYPLKPYEVRFKTKE